MNAAKAHYENAEVQLSYAQITQSDLRRGLRTGGLSGRNAASGIAAGFDCRYFASGGARECAGEGRRVDQGGPAGDGSRARTAIFRER